MFRNVRLALLRFTITPCSRLSSGTVTIRLAIAELSFCVGIYETPHGWGLRLKTLYTIHTVHFSLRHLTIWYTYTVLYCKVLHSEPWQSTIQYRLKVRIRCCVEKTDSLINFNPSVNVKFVAHFIPSIGSYTGAGNYNARSTFYSVEWPSTYP